MRRANPARARTMLGSRIKLFTVFGFTVRLHPSWLLLALLVAATMADGFRDPPASFATGTSWLMGLAVVVGLFVSIVLHELTHSLVARLHGMEMRGITVFLLGGVAEMTDEPPTPWAEFTMAIVGPLASLAIAGALFGAWWVAQAASLPPAIVTVLTSLALMNVALAVFNMVPGFPLDGGRVLRAVLWGWKGSLSWATRVAATLGMACGGLFVAIGLVFVFAWPRTWQGLTWVAVGAFLVSASAASRRQAGISRALAGFEVGRFTRPDVAVIPRWMSIDDFVREYAEKQRDPSFVVVDHAGLIELVRAETARRVPRDRWASHSVGEIAGPIPPALMIASTAPAEEALVRMHRFAQPRLFVFDGARLAGAVRLVEILAFAQGTREPRE